MAQVLFRSFATSDGIGANSVSPAKPAGLAVNDLMIAQAVSDGTSSDQTMSAPAGWTQIRQNSTGTFRGFAIFSKLADAADVAASSFTFTRGDTNGVIKATVFAVHANGLVPSVNVFDGTTRTSSSGALTTGGVTPTLSDALLTILASASDNDSETFGSYSIVNNNPSWTEAYDSNTLSGAFGATTAMAYGQRTLLTATGTVSATVSDPVNASDITILAITPPALTPAAGTLSAVSVFSIPVVLENTLQIVSSIVAPTVSIVESLWRNARKSANNGWRNRPKS